MKYNEVPIFTGIMGGIAFTTYFFRVLNFQLILTLIIMSILGALVSITLQFLLKKSISNSDNKSSILESMYISILPFSLFFATVIVSISVLKLGLTYQHLIWGLILSFLVSTMVLLIKLRTIDKARNSIARASASFIVATIIAISIPSTLHWYVWNSSPCANGQCTIDTHTHANH